MAEDQKGKHATVHVTVQRKVGGAGWNGSEAYVRFDVIDRHKSDAHFYVRTDSYLGKTVKAGDRLEITRK